MRPPFPGETLIPPFLAAYYLLTLAAVVAAWMKGGHPERLGAAAILVVFAGSYLTHPLRVGAFYAGDAAIDAALTAFFIWMSLTRDRWWPLLMSAVMVLTLMVYVASLGVTGLGPYAVISARIGLGILTALALLIGPAERWLAGERAVSPQAVWRRRRLAP